MTAFTPLWNVFELLRSQQKCTAFVEIFLCLNSAAQLKVELVWTGNCRSRHHMRNGFDRESNPRPQRWPALMIISNIDLTTAPLWQPTSMVIGSFPSKMWQTRLARYGVWSTNSITCDDILLEHIFIFMESFLSKMMSWWFSTGVECKRGLLPPEEIAGMWARKPTSA
jgi:hypothetical protein